MDYFLYMYTTEIVMIEVRDSTRSECLETTNVSNPPEPWPTRFTRLLERTKQTAYYPRIHLVYGDGCGGVLVHCCFLLFLIFCHHGNRDRHGLNSHHGAVVLPQNHAFSLQLPSQPHVSSATWCVCFETIPKKK